MGLQGQRVVVAGGTSGIGLAVARAVFADGADVVLVGRDRRRLDGAAAALAGCGTVEPLVADVAREADVVRLFEHVGPCDHIVSTAADLVYEPVRTLDMTAVRRAVDSKLLGALLLAKHGGAALRPSGSLTLTSGIAAHRPGPRGAVTAAVNGALEGLGRALALELAPVRVNVVSPGWVDTPIWERVAGDRRGAVQAAMAARLPPGRIGTPEEIAAAFLFLMQNAFTTGTVVHVDGGHRLV